MGVQVKDMLMLKADEFWREVSRAVSPKPWKHDRNVDDHCPRCGVMITDRGMVTKETATPCTVPPRLMDAPEVVVRRLRDACDKARLAHVVERLCPLAAAFAGDSWYAYYATPREQVACCLVSLGDWEM